jgi:hypothetical protein
MASLPIPFGSLHGFCDRDYPADGLELVSVERWTGDVLRTFQAHTPGDVSDFAALAIFGRDNLDLHVVEDYFLAFTEVDLGLDGVFIQVSSPEIKGLTLKGMPAFAGTLRPDETHHKTSGLAARGLTQLLRRSLG